MKFRHIAVGTFLACTTFATGLFAQSIIAGDITGTVYDQSGAIVSGAEVTLTSLATNAMRTTETNVNGVYRLAFVASGEYKIIVRAAGFYTSEKRVIALVDVTQILDFDLRVGSPAETVEVNSTTSTVGETPDSITDFDRYLIENLPNAGNDLTDIAQTAPGVVMNTGGGYGNFQAYGLPSVSNLFTVNGQNTMEPYLNINSLGGSKLMLGRNETQEATITVNDYSGQFGQQAGVQVNYVTKSGTNELHGNVIYWWTGRAMDANDWFNNRTDPVTPRPFANNNQWAGSIGGPIKKDKVFFFVDNEGITYIVPSTGLVSSPSPQFATATLDNLATVNPASIPLYSKMFRLYQEAPGYNTRTPVAGGGCQDFTPTFDGPCFVQYQASPSEPASEWMLVGRVDVNLTNDDKAFARVSLDHGTQATYADPINSAFDAASYEPIYNGQAQWTHVFGPNATNSFIMAGSYYRYIFSQKNAVATFPISVGMGGLGYTGMAAGEGNFPQGRTGTQYQFIDDLSLTKLKHSFKVGISWRRYDYTDYDVSTGSSPSAGINSVTQFYNGQSVSFFQNFPSSASEPVALWGMGLYAQDEWRVRKNLTLTVALRLEKNSDPVCRTNCASYLSAPFYAESTNPNTPYNDMIVTHRQKVFPSTDPINLAPRFGFAWSPGATVATVVRGGVGIFYDAVPAVLGNSSMTNVPNVISMFLCCAENWADTTSAGPSASAATSAAAIRSGFLNGASFNSLSSSVGANFSAPNFTNFLGVFHTSQYQKWSLQIEQQLNRYASLTVAYVGNHGIHIPIYNTPNLFGSGLSDVPSTPYNPSFAYVGEFYTGGISNYNGATVAYNMRVSYSFNLQVSYTWGHALDEVSNGGILVYSNSSLPFQVNPLCLVCNNYGNADYDIRNSFSAAYVWAIPFTSRKEAAKSLLGGWTVSQNFFARSGLPFGVFDATTYIDNVGTMPAQVISESAQMSCKNGNSQCLNPSAFESVAAYGAIPTQTRNLFRGPGFFDSDLSVTKNINVTERLTLQLGTNLYNVLNHPNFGNPSGSLTNFDSAGRGLPGGNFGLITGTIAPPTSPYGAYFGGLPSGRIVQFQGKLVF